MIDCMMQVVRFRYRNYFCKVYLSRVFEIGVTADPMVLRIHPNILIVFSHKMMIPIIYYSALFNITGMLLSGCSIIIRPVNLSMVCFFSNT